MLSIDNSDLSSCIRPIVKNTVSGSSAIGPAFDWTINVTERFDFAGAHRNQAPSDFSNLPVRYDN